MQHTEIQILFDNHTYRDNMTGLWGFACLVVHDGYTILFDTGSNGRILLQNMERMNIDPAKINWIMTSHPHWDHTGGLDSVLELNPSAKLCLPASLSPYMIRDLERLSGKTVIINDHPEEFLPAFHSTGTMSVTGEQALVIERADGIIVITGCAHAGIDKVVARAMETLAKPVILVLGGFHLMDSPEEKIEKTIQHLQELGVKKVCPTHCTGEAAMNLFRERFGKNFTDGGAGKLISI
jgi:7,8-dihydropterin-6-yl-methyl-4-(beta-D-ribofuranosyl)aminobenzene 5'-phosphate synthase